MDNVVSGYVMSGDEIVAKVINNDVDILQDNLCPLLIKRTTNITDWLENRAIDRHRPSSRILRKMLRITNSNDINVVLKFNAVSITDNYWFKTLDSNETWNEVKSATDYFSSYILDGCIDLDAEYGRTFELTNIGSYEKCWKKYNNQWYMLKKQSKVEIDSEYTSYKIAKILDFPVAEYKKGENDIIITKSFINNWNYNFEDAYSIVGDEEDVSYNFNLLKQYGNKVLQGYYNMLVFDAIVMNTDRHTHNYGVLKDIVTGKVIDFAPLYDHNMTLKACKSILKDKSNRLFFDNVLEFLNLYKPNPIKYIDVNDFKSVTDDIKLQDFIINNYKEIKKIEQKFNLK